MGYLTFSQSLIPSVITINKKKIYCYDSLSIRKIAVELNDKFSCDSISKIQNITIAQQDTLIKLKQLEIINIDSSRSIAIKERDIYQDSFKQSQKKVSQLKVKNTLTLIGAAAVIGIVIWIIK